jgi:hypothetical protein
MLVAAATTICATTEDNKPQKTQQYKLANYLFWIYLTMPSKEVDSCSDDDESIILEGGKHMYWHDFVLCYLYVCLVSCVTCTLGAFWLISNTRIP